MRGNEETHGCKSHRYPAELDFRQDESTGDDLPRTSLWWWFIVDVMGEENGRAGWRMEVGGWRLEVGD